LSVCRQQPFLIVLHDAPAWSIREPMSDEECEAHMHMVPTRAWQSYDRVFVYVPNSMDAFLLDAL
jgi:hypothetical protein